MFFYRVCRTNRILQGTLTGPKIPYFLLILIIPPPPGALCTVCTLCPLIHITLFNEMTKLPSSNLNEKHRWMTVQKYIWSYKIIQQVKQLWPWHDDKTEKQKHETTSFFYFVYIKSLLSQRPSLYKCHLNSTWTGQNIAKNSSSCTREYPSLFKINMEWGRISGGILQRFTLFESATVRLI